MRPQQCIQEYNKQGDRCNALSLHKSMHLVALQKYTGYPHESHFLPGASGCDSGLPETDMVARADLRACLPYIS